MSETTKKGRRKKVGESDSAFQDFTEMTRKLLNLSKNDIEEIETKERMLAEADKKNISISKAKPKT